MTVIRAAFVSLFLVLAACASGSDKPSGSGHASGTDRAKDSGTGDSEAERGDASVGVPELGSDASRELTVVGTAADGLDVPRDLEFDPDHPDQLWVVNRGDNSVVIYTSPGTREQVAEKRIDAYAAHFMAKPSAFAFGIENRFASCQESRNDWNDVTNVPQAEDDIMGPTLWLADLDVFARVGQQFPFAWGRPEGSHIDMLHESPLCMGIAHDHDNAYWVFDGLHGQIVYYDFVKNHEPGGGDHTDGIVRRYFDAKLTRLADVPGHLALDHDTGWLYVADTGTGKIMRLDTNSGVASGPPAEQRTEALAEYTQMTSASFELVAKGLAEPSGLALGGGRLFVTEHGSGDIVMLDMEGKELARAATGAEEIMGITLGPDGKLWYVDAAANTVVRVDP